LPGAAPFNSNIASRLTVLLHRQQPLEAARIGACRVEQAALQSRQFDRRTRKLVLNRKLFQRQKVWSEVVGHHI